MNRCPTRSRSARKPRCSMSTPIPSSNPYRGVLRRRPRAISAWSSATSRHHPIMDLAGARMLHQLHLDLACRGIALRIVGARGRVRDLLRAEGMGEKVGGLDRRVTLNDLLGGAGR